MNAAQDIINGRGGLFRPQDGILARRLKYVKGVLERNFQGTYSIVHEIELIDESCFDLVVRKLK